MTQIRQLRGYIDLVEALKLREEMHYGEIDVDPHHPDDPVPELEDAEEFDDEVENGGLTVKPKRLPEPQEYTPIVKRTVRESGDFRINDMVAKEFNPFEPVGRIDMLKEGFARVTDGGYTRWIPNHELVVLLDIVRKPEFTLKEAVCHRDDPYSVVGTVSYFSSDGGTAYVDDSRQNEIVPYEVGELLKFNSGRRISDYDPELDDPSLF